MLREGLAECLPFAGPAGGVLNTDAGESNGLRRHGKPLHVEIRDNPGEARIFLPDEIFSRNGDVIKMDARSV